VLSIPYLTPLNITAVAAIAVCVFVLVGLSTLAMCAPSDKFLYMGGPLAMGLGVVFVSSIGLYRSLTFV